MIPAFFSVTRVAETGSTNDDLKRAAEAGAGEGLVITAARQTAGRGRRGRDWSSPTGNLYVSLLLRPQCDPLRASLVSFVTALAVSETVRALAPQAQVQLKWPNDVLVDGGKISGILLESAPMTAGRVDWLVVGMGLNIATAPENALYPTKSLAACGVQASVEEALALYLNAFKQFYDALQHDGFAPLRERWLDQAKKGGMIARLPSEEVRGTFADLDETGRLVLRLEDGTLRAISAADVFFA